MRKKDPPINCFKLKEAINNFDILVRKAKKFLKEESYSESTINCYGYSWNKLRRYIIANELIVYDKDVEINFLNFTYGNKPLKEFRRIEKDDYLRIKKLLEFKETGKILYRYNRVKNITEFSFSGAVGEVMQACININKNERLLSYYTIHNYKHALHKFLNYCNSKKVLDPKNIDLPFIFKYLRSIDQTKKSAAPMAVSIIRIFTRYLFEKKILKIDISKRLPFYRQIKQPELPSTYTEEEIQILIKSIDRSTLIGKRDYLIILLAARLGLRASDICNLQFKSIRWETNTIEIEQIKTAKTLVLPLFPDIGNAMIEYLKYSRPISKEPYLFVKITRPYGHFGSGRMVTKIVQEAFKKSGLNIRDKKFGPHALRHSLASRLLEQKTMLPVISEVLGHGYTESTLYYLRIDIESMKQCMLEVPQVRRNFYLQISKESYV